MFLADSNIIIYSYFPEYAYLRNLILTENVFISEISRLEVLGYHKLTSIEQDYFKDIFSFVEIIMPDKAIFDLAINIRKQYKLKSADSLIAATAITNGLTIYTRNIVDFHSINSVNYINPIKEP